jgi:hypothetical protein
VRASLHTAPPAIHCVPPPACYCGASAITRATLDANAEVRAGCTQQATKTGLALRQAPQHTTTPGREVHTAAAQKEILVYLVVQAAASNWVIHSETRYAHTYVSRQHTQNIFQDTQLQAGQGQPGSTAAARAPHQPNDTTATLPPHTLLHTQRCAQRALAGSNHRDSPPIRAAGCHQQQPHSPATSSL